MRLLGYPRDFELEGRPRELAEWARAWYAENARPWIYAAQTAAIAGSLNQAASRIEGAPLHIARLSRAHVRSRPKRALQ